MEPSQDNTPRQDPDPRLNADDTTPSPFDASRVVLTDPIYPEDLVPTQEIELDCRRLMSCPDSQLPNLLSNHLSRLAEYDFQRGVYSDRTIQWPDTRNFYDRFRLLPPEDKEFIANSIALEIALSVVLQKEWEVVGPVLIDALKSDSKARAGVLAAINRGGLAAQGMIDLAVDVLIVPELRIPSLELIDLFAGQAIHRLEDILVHYPQEMLWDEFNLDEALARARFASIFAKFERLDQERTWSAMRSQIENPEEPAQLAALSLLHSMEAAPEWAREEVLKLALNEDHSQKTQSRAIAVIRKHEWTNDLSVDFLIQVARESEIDSDLMEQALCGLSELGEPRDEIYGLYSGLWADVSELVTTEDFEFDTSEGVFIAASLLPALAKHDAICAESGALFRQFLFSEHAPLRTAALEAIPKARVPIFIEELLARPGRDTVDDIMILLDPKVPDSVPSELLVRVRDRIQKDMESYDILDQFSAQEVVDKIDAELAARN